MSSLFYGLCIVTIFDCSLKVFKAFHSISFVSLKKDFTFYYIFGSLNVYFLDQLLIELKLGNKIRKSYISECENRFSLICVFYFGIFVNMPFLQNWKSAGIYVTEICCTYCSSFTHVAVHIQIQITQQNCSVLVISMASCGTRTTDCHLSSFLADIIDRHEIGLDAFHNVISGFWVYSEYFLML